MNELITTEISSGKEILKAIKRIELKHFVLLMLILILIVPVFNTAHLYGMYSDLEGNEKKLVTYFLGIVVELSVFTCILAGYRLPGIFFAILSFIIGLLYHLPFEDVREINNWHEHGFISKAVIQFVISSLVYFLSELFVWLRSKENKVKTIKDLIKKIRQLRISITEKQSIVSSLQREADELITNNRIIQSETRQLKKEAERLQTEIKELQEEREHLKRSIAATKRELQK